MSEDGECDELFVAQAHLACSAVSSTAVAAGQVCRCVMPPREGREKRDWVSTKAVRARGSIDISQCTRPSACTGFHISPECHAGLVNAPSLSSVPTCLIRLKAGGEQQADAESVEEGKRLDWTLAS